MRKVETLFFVLKKLKRRYGKKLMDEIPIRVLNENNKEVFYADCLEKNGRLEKVLSKKVREIRRIKDWYNDEGNEEGLMKFGFEIVIKEDDFWDEQLLKLLAKEKRDFRGH